MVTGVAWHRHNVSDAVPEDKRTLPEACNEIIPRHAHLVVGGVLADDEDLLLWDERQVVRARDATGWERTSRIEGERSAGQACCITWYMRCSAPAGADRRTSHTVSTSHDRQERARVCTPVNAARVDLVGRSGHAAQQRQDHLRVVVLLQHDLHGSVDSQVCLCVLADADADAEWH